MKLYRPDPDAAARFLFFTGKGGVGKTSIASATALRLADAGRRVLLISTDPASNLDEVLDTPLGREPVAVRGVSGLHALNIDPVEAAAVYRERVIGPLRGVLPDDVLRGMEEQLSGSCTVEIAAFDEFTSYLASPEATSAYDHVVFDTAPTGHTLRLMALAGAWTGFLDANTSGQSCLGPLAGLEKQRALYQSAVQILGDPSRTSLYLVARPQSASLREAARTSTELRALGIQSQQLIVNGKFTVTDELDPIATAWAKRGADALAEFSGLIASMSATFLPLRHHNILGIEGLRRLLDGVDGMGDVEAKIGEAELPAGFMDSDEWLKALSGSGRGVIMTMGKGGVGKTTMAAAIATGLARRGHRVHLTTTDPAAHLDQAMGGQVELLTVGRIDPEAETEAYRAEVIAGQREELDEAGLALLEEDLRSPCTEEVAVFRAFAREVARGEEGFVVLDTAPTGHTLLLLDASESYSRELERQSRNSPTDVGWIRKLLPRLRDPEFTRVVLVTLPEATPVHEAAALQEDLRRAGIEPHSWIVNQSLTGCDTSDPLLLRRAAAESAYLREILETHATRAILIPWQPEEPAGPDALEGLFSSTTICPA